MLKSALLNLKGGSFKQIDIEDIIDGCLKLPSSKYRLILATSSINFELKSEEEQDALIDIYESFLNSIGFPLQFLIRTREIDMDSYLESLKAKMSLEKEAIYKKQLHNYSLFISSLISSNKILSRQFFVILPFDPPKTLDDKMARTQLHLRADIVSKNLARLGISAKELSSIDIIDLFYSFYSPEQAKLQPISDRALEVMNNEFIVRNKNV